MGRPPKTDHYCPLREEGLGGTTWLNGCHKYHDCFTCSIRLEDCPANNGKWEARMNRQNGCRLTELESRVLTEAAEGKSAREMAEEMGVSIKAALQVRTRIFEKMGARNMPHAVALGFQKGYLQ